MPRAVGYIRRSSKDAGGKLSIEGQERDIADLAQRHELVVADVQRDLGRSGGDYKGDPDSDALAHRPGFRAVLRAVEAREVDAVLASRIDRLGRSQNALGRLWAACERTGTKVITTEGDMADPGNPATVLLGGMLGVFAEYYLAEQVRKNARAMEYCRRRGDDFGAPAFGYEKQTPKHHGTERVEMVKADPEGIARVLDAYRAAGCNYRQAALRLNEAGVKPARTDKWYATSVAAVVRRHAPELAVQAQERRARTTVPRLFRRLLKCHCGSLMTPQDSSRSLGYVCPQGHHDARHPRPIVVSERKLLPWIVKEAARLRLPGDVLEVDVPGQDADDSADRATLAAMRERIGEVAYLAGIAALDAAKEAHTERMTELLDIPQSIDWEGWTPQAVNAVLRAYWESVELGPDLLPVRAVWRLPAEYVA
jgi:DNA invertase Pin-like site-specific DNA recombinase